MNRTLVFAFVGIAAIALAAAAAVRVNDAPYITYAEGDRSGAMAGLERKAAAGDGFAAFLVGNGYRDGTSGDRDPRTAAAWYMTAARGGELHAVSAYLGVVLSRQPDPAHCHAAVALLEIAGRAGDSHALILLGRLYEKGICAEADLVRAAGYYLAAERIDRRFGKVKDQVLARLSPEIAATVRPIPDRFDLTGNEALARFIAEAQALPE